MEQLKDVYNVSYDPDLDAVTMEWNGYATSEQFRTGTELMLKTMQEHHASKVAGNITDFVLIGMEDQKWMLKEFLPQAIAQGFRKCALTIPMHYFNKVAVESIINGINSEGFEIRLFENFEDAKAWIKA